ncbi:MAG: TlpA disulfide reductase family protein [Methyloprofundus sp.]|nr:TlpA disulfide reductase family protein [Methyloprofundus sp.]
MLEFNKTFILSLFIIISSVALYIYYPRPQIAPDVSFKTIDNKQVSLKQLQGKVVLVTFWATDCPSCLTEIDHLKKLYQDYHHRGFELFAIAMYYDRPNHIVETSKAYQIPYDIALDLRMQLANAFGNVRLTPTTFLINPKGEIIYQNTGIFDPTAMHAQIEFFLPTQGNK